MTEKILDSSKILAHIDKIQNILVELMAPREAITSLEAVRFNYLHVEQRMTALVNFDALIESADKKKSRQSWSDKNKRKVWELRFIKKQTPKQIALIFDVNPSQISNLIQQMRLKGYVHE